MAGIRYAVFWDYENQPGHPAHASQAVADAVNSLGANVCEERRLYSDPHISNVALSRHVLTVQQVTITPRNVEMFRMT